MKNQNTTVPAIFVTRGCRSIGYGSTGQAAPYGRNGWFFFPDGEPDRGICCIEEELFFPDRGPICEKSGYEAIVSDFLNAPARVWGGGAFYTDNQKLVVRSRPGALLRNPPIHFQAIQFPWGEEIVAAELFDPGWRTVCPLFGEWELVDLGTGDGTITFRKVAV